MFSLTLLLQIFSKLCFHLKDLLKIIRLLLAALSVNGLTSVVWAYDSFENNLGINPKLEYNLKEVCWILFIKHLSFEYSFKNAFVREISAKELGSFGCYRHE